MQNGGFSPALFVLQCPSQSLSSQVESTAFVAENVPPPAGSSRLHLSVPAEGDGAGSSDDNDARLASRSSQKCDLSVMGEFIFVAGDQFFGVSFLVFRAAA